MRAPVENGTSKLRYSSTRVCTAQENMGFPLTPKIANLDPFLLEAVHYRRGKRTARLPAAHGSHGGPPRQQPQLGPTCNCRRPVTPAAMAEDGGRAAQEARWRRSSTSALLVVAVPTTIRCSWLRTAGISYQRPRSAATRFKRPHRGTRYATAARRWRHGCRGAPHEDATAGPPLVLHVVAARPPRP